MNVLFDIFSLVVDGKDAVDQARVGKLKAHRVIFVCIPIAVAVVALAWIWLSHYGNPTK